MDNRQAVQQMCRKLLRWRPNDAVGLLVTGGEPPDLQRLDLCGVVEGRRSAQGAVELKFADKFQAARILLEMEEGETQPGLYQALLDSSRAIRERGDGDALQ